MIDTPVIWAHGLTKRYGATIALAGVDLAVPTGRVLGLLGPNGAGKTTVVRILTTLAVPDGGRATVGGHDVVTEAMAVRRDIGVAAQDATLDPMLTGRQNLVMIGRLAGLSWRQATAAAADLLERFDLARAAGQVLKGYSGGMRRRLDLAAAIITRPPVLFLDEPTTGLDPVSRQGVWTIVRDLVGAGTTVLLTTQYLDEADQLADSIAVIGHGRVIAEGTARSLKSQIGGARVEVSLTRPDPAAAEVLAAFAAGPVSMDAEGLRLRAGVASAAGLATAVVRAFDQVGISVDDIEVRQPSLDDVFFALAGQPALAGASR